MVSSPAQQSKVLIVGAGPAGAFLAQILRGKGIDFEIFDREADLHEPKSGGFALDSSIPVMAEHLPSDVGDWWTTSVNYLQYDNTVQIDANTSEVRGYQLGRSRDEQHGERPKSIIVCRHKFRSWMVQHLPVQTDKLFSHYDQNESGVTAYFKDGSSAHGSVLVGADGAGSVVRRQLLGTSKRELHTFVPICGSFEIKGEPLKRLQAIASAGIVTSNANVQVMVSPLELQAGTGGEARYWWVVAFRSQDPEADTNWIHSATADALYTKVMTIAEGMPEFTVEALKLAGPSSVWNPQIRFSEYVAPDALPEGRVTLMGDAAHNTTPYGGMGANTGIKDAADLGSLLCSQKWDSQERRGGFAAAVQCCHAAAWTEGCVEQPSCGY